MGPKYFFVKKNFYFFGVQFYNFTIEYTNKKSANFTTDNLMTPFTGFTVEILRFSATFAASSNILYPKKDCLVIKKGEESGLSETLATILEIAEKVPIPGRKRNYNLNEEKCRKSKPTKKLTGN